MNLSNVDILNTDLKIKEKFKSESDKLLIYKEKLDDLEKSFKGKDTTKSNKTIRFQIKIEVAIKELKNKIENIETKKDFNFYLLESVDLIEKYKSILQVPVKMNFMGKIIIDNKEKDEIILKYLEIAKKYTNIELENQKINNLKVSCNNCLNKKLFDILDDSVYICLICGSQQEILLHTSSYKDINRINISSKYTYDRKVHFRDCINQYQGKQNCTIDKKVYEKLIDQFEKHNLLLGDKTIARNIRCSKITKDHIHIFLKELNFTKHYENVNLIHYQLTGIKPDDISHLENKLLNDFDMLTELYDKKFKNKPGFDRKNFINTQFILLSLLLKYKHPCKKEDFTVLKTVDRIFFHVDITRELFEELSWNYTVI